MAAPQPYFTIEAAKGGYRAHFYGANYQLVWWTEVYTSKQAAAQAIQFVKNWGPTAAVSDRVKAA